MSEFLVVRGLPLSTSELRYLFCSSGKFKKRIKNVVNPSLLYHLPHEEGVKLIAIPFRVLYSLYFL